MQEIFFLTGLRRITAAAVFVSMVSACSSGGDSSRRPAAACLTTYSYNGVEYIAPLGPSDKSVEFTIGPKLGTAKHVPCVDVVGRESGRETARADTGETVTIYAIKELPSDAAVALDVGNPRKQLLTGLLEDGSMDTRAVRFIKEERRRAP